MRFYKPATETQRVVVNRWWCSHHRVKRRTITIRWPDFESILVVLPICIIIADK